jgi:FkbM family methyltransferase
MNKKIKRFIKNSILKGKRYLWYTPFQKSLVDAQNTNEGFIKLFNKDFHYHHGMAFYDTYREVFETEIYRFDTNRLSPLIIDCGANMGLSVLFFSKNYPDAKIYAFEPDPTVLPFIEKNIKNYELKNVVLCPKAVWNEETELTFYTDDGLGGRIGLEYENKKPVFVSTVRLKDLLNQEVDMLKIDIEGAEYTVLKDCEEVLSNVKLVFVEYHSFYDETQHLDEILSIFKRQGFRYHLKQSFSRSRPFTNRVVICEKFDMAINVFAYKE